MPRYESLYNSTTATGYYAFTPLRLFHVIVLVDFYERANLERDGRPPAAKHFVQRRSLDTTRYISMSTSFVSAGKVRALTALVASRVILRTSPLDVKMALGTKGIRRVFRMRGLKALCAIHFV